MTMIGRRTAMQALGLGTIAGAMSLSAIDQASAKEADGSVLVPSDGHHLKKLSDQLDKLTRRRDFKTVPMILTETDQWDAEALNAVISYKAPYKQVWDNTEIGSPWLNLMRNSINAQVWSFKHPDFLAVSATHGTAHLALFDDATWEKYQLTKLAGQKFKSNTLIKESSAAKADAKNFEDANGVFSPADNSIPILMRRGVVFLSCHNAIWEEAAALLKAESNPDKLNHEQLAAELTNHLLPGVVLTPGAVGTLPELQRAGFHYAK
ncbi:transcriptional initiation protein Tat [Bradyrhizobium sp. UASWS1016]|jgi:hypothetical protein|uniref:Transcriptional initiation protein Tat n=2 Tax=Nitrobacteraceae TaxID=41294 RepID=A0A5P6PH27_9BRAD|nr:MULTISPECIES: transcriptional initiation protein Tat [Bradyrhizobium]AUD00332.1 transcriptional initiation protein Tat [Bradyrhizobium sp. SK17]MCS3730917.1 hypothetical protein [Bradyrhizobium betae]OCX32622.1 transcriptional initiation protein Tat [Bradyrhizobium sp. UASWS1016]QFI77590.1 transcriptional initiation protein Tat [Bradyrhizobium betae]